MDDKQRQKLGEVAEMLGWSQLSFPGKDGPGDLLWGLTPPPYHPPGEINATHVFPPSRNDANGAFWLIDELWKRDISVDIQQQFGGYRFKLSAYTNASEFFNGEGMLWDNLTCREGHWLPEVVLDIAHAALKSIQPKTGKSQEDEPVGPIPLPTTLSSGEASAIQYLEYIQRRVAGVFDLSRYTLEKYSGVFDLSGSICAAEMDGISYLPTHSFCLCPPDLLEDYLKGSLPLEEIQGRASVAINVEGISRWEEGIPASVIDKMVELFPGLKDVPRSPPPEIDWEKVRNTLAIELLGWRRGTATRGTEIWRTVVSSEWHPLDTWKPDEDVWQALSLLDHIPNSGWTSESIPPATNYTFELPYHFIKAQADTFSKAICLAALAYVEAMKLPRVGMVYLESGGYAVFSHDTGENMGHATSGPDHDGIAYMMNEEMNGIDPIKVHPISIQGEP